MLSDVEEAKRLLYSRRLHTLLVVRLQDQEDEILDAKAAGATISNLRPYHPRPGGPLSRAYPDGVAIAAAGLSVGEIRSVDVEDRMLRRAKRESRRGRFRKRGRGGGEQWIEASSFAWGEKEREDIREALGSGGEESEGEEGRLENGMVNLVEAAEMVMKDVADEVKVRVPVCVCMFVCMYRCVNVSVAVCIMFTLTCKYRWPLKKEQECFY